MDSSWLVIALVVLVVLGLVYRWADDQPNPSAPTSTDLEIITLLRQDIARVTFVELYQRFPFDTRDSKYLDIQALERQYAKAVHLFVYYWNEASHLATSMGAQTPTYAPEMFTHMQEIEDCLKHLNDTMMMYCNVESDAMRTFETYSESVHDWFRDLRRRNQGVIKGFT